MRPTIYASRLLSIVVLTAMLSCNKSITGTNANLAPLNPSSEDLTAGTWKTILLTRPDTFAVAAPSAITSPAYTADLNEIIGYQKNMTCALQNQIDYWSLTLE